MGVHIAGINPNALFYQPFCYALPILGSGMAAQRITMRKIPDILRLRLAAGLSIRQIRHSTKASVGAIQKLLVRADQPGLPGPCPTGWVAMSECWTSLAEALN